jgi:indolepyruvate ferredoxin oxidoreductase beta subunit
MKEFDVVLTGVGGQGILTLGNLVAHAVLFSGHDVKTTELHGLAQRGGSIPFQLRFGKKINSALIMEGDANLIVSMEPLEALRASYYSSREKGTSIIFDDKILTPVTVSVLGQKYPPIKGIKKALKQFSKDIRVVSATRIVKEKTGSELGSNTFMLGYIVGSKLLPLKPKNVLKAIQKILKPKYFELNKKIFEMGLKYKL